jgi:hypothetical protein
MKNQPLSPKEIDSAVLKSHRQHPHLLYVNSGVVAAFSPTLTFALRFFKD